HKVTEKNKQAILNAQRNGIEVVIATGRGYPEAKNPVLQAQLNLAYICLNGAEVRDQQGKVISSTYLDEHHVREILSVLDHESIDSLLFIGDHMYTKSIENLVDSFIQLGMDTGQTLDVEAIRSEVMNSVEDGYIRTTESFDHLIDEHGKSIYKVFGSTTDHEALNRAHDTLKKLSNLADTSYGSNKIEKTRDYAQKEIALEQYAKSKGISMEHVMVIGDSHNDLSMMEKAKVSYAMANAPDEIKSACTHITTANENDGVALAIEKM